MRLTPFSFSGGPNGPTERAQIKYCVMEIDITVDGSGHILRTTRCCCAVAARKVSVRSDLAGEAQDSGWIQTRFFIEERNERP